MELRHFLQRIDISKLTHLQSLTALTAAGEEFQISHYEEIWKEFSGTVVNAYGVNETTVYNIVNSFESGAPFKNTLGQILSNTKKFVVNDRLQLLPRGAIGDLCLAGDCLARSYLNKPEITNQRFVANPFQTKEENRDGKFTHIYKTGDLVRYSADGELEYLGRNDFQVKILGLRIELGEIESVLVSYPIVKQCAIIAKYKEKLHHSKQAKYLIGYYVLAGMTVLESELNPFCTSIFLTIWFQQDFFALMASYP